MDLSQAHTLGLSLKDKEQERGEKAFLFAKARMGPSASAGVRRVNKKGKLRKEKGKN